MNDLKYIENNFIEENELCKVTNISQEKLYELIKNKLLPSSSYEIKTEIKISSKLQDEKTITQIKRYFHKSCIELIQNNINLKSQVFKESFKKEYMETLNKDDTLNLNYKKELEDMFESEWNYFLDGVYGICTLNTTPQEIVKKSIVVQKMIEFLEQKDTLSLRKKQDRLKTLNDAYNEISSTFAPYQREKSSRGKYIDKQLKEIGLENLIKK